MLPGCCESFGCCIHVQFTGNIGCGRSHQNVTVSGGRNKHSLAHCGGKLEQRGACKITVRLVQKFVFSLSCRNRVLLRAQHIIYNVAANAGAVYNRFRRIAAPVLGFYDKQTVFVAHGYHSFVKLETRAVGCGVFRVCYCHFVRAYYSRSGNVQRIYHLSAYRRLHFARLISRNDFKSAYAVFLALLKQFFQFFCSFLGEIKHHCAVFAVRKVELSGHFGKQSRAAYVVARFERSRMSVEAGVNYARIGFGCAYG